MREFISTDTRKTKKSTRIAAIAAGLFFILLGIIRPSIYAGMIGLVMLAAMMLRKKTAVTEEGIVVTYDAIVYKYVETWAWEEIQEIHKELSPEATKYALHFMKDIMSKRLVYSLRDAQKVLELAQESNPKIHIGNVNE